MADYKQRIEDIKRRAAWNEEGLETVSSGYLAATSVGQINDDIEALLAEIERLKDELAIAKQGVAAYRALQRDLTDLQNSEAHQ